MKTFNARLNRNLIAAAFDSCMACLSFMLSVYLRLGDEQPEAAVRLALQGAPVFTLVCIAVFITMRFYRGLWRYASLRDLLAIVKSVTLATLIFASLLFIVNRLEGVPRSLFFINWMLLIGLLGGPRFLYRAVKDRSLTWEMKLNEEPRIPVLIIDGNDNAEQFIRDMARSRSAPYEVVGIADDDPRQKGRSIHQVMIYGSTDILPTIVRKLERKGRRPQKLVLADDRAGGERVRHLLAIADELGIPLARLPRPGPSGHGFADRPEVKPIAVEDLLGRAQNVQDREGLRRLVEGKAVLITGAGGTIGSELARQVAGYNPRSLVLAEISEFNLYQIERELRAAFALLPISATLCDVRDSAHIDQMLAHFRPQLVLHAAAIKHVPLAEQNIEETLLTNVMGTRRVAEACQRHGVGTMVMISTDKAVNPTNVMGASKRLAESICQALGQEQPQGATSFVTVRFGNVLGSTGSVVPLFAEQIAKGGPVTVTHPEITRYFMTVREAVELVLQAASMAQAMQRREHIFVLDMGQPVRILDLARQMIKLAGLREGEDIEIRFSGLRPGEKLHEELFHFSESAGKTAHEGIFLASPRFTEWQRLRPSLDQLCSACEKRDAPAALALLKQLVAEFTHDQDRAGAAVRLG